MGVGDVVVAEAAVVVAGKDDPLVVKAEGEPLVVKAEDDPLVAAAEGDGEGVVPHGLAVEAQAVTVLATTCWSLITGGVRLAARLGLVGGSNSSGQCGNCSVGRLGLSRVATG